MTFATLPGTAAWRHQEARVGFETAWFRSEPDGFRLSGCTTGLEDGRTWAVSYEIALDDGWRTRWAQVLERSSAGSASLRLDADGAGGWRVDGVPEPALDGLVDVDLESSAMTNTLPVHRLDPPRGIETTAPAVYVRLGLDVQRIEQTYRRLDGGPPHRFAYASPAFDFTCELAYDEAGLVTDYPGIAVRVH